MDYRSGQVHVDQETLVRLARWTKSNEPRILWAEGSFGIGSKVNHALSTMALRFVELADGSDVAVMSYFCEIRRDTTLRSGNTKENQATIELLYALIRQTTELLLPHFDTKIDMSEARLASLDGTIKTWKDALLVFEDVTSLIPENSFCVIDGLDWLDDNSNESYLDGFLQALRKSRLKTLFMTTGRSGVLRKTLSRLETMQISNVKLERGKVGFDGSDFWTTEDL